MSTGANCCSIRLRTPPNADVSPQPTKPSSVSNLMSNDVRDVYKYVDGPVGRGSECRNKKVFTELIFIHSRVAVGGVSAANFRRRRRLLRDMGDHQPIRSTQYAG